MALGDRIQVGMDFSKYAILSKEFDYTNTVAINTYSQAFKIDGKGYISQITSHYSNGHGLKITIDGVVVFESYAGGYATGIILEEYKLITNGSTIMRYKTTNYSYTPAAYPIIDSSTNQKNYVCLLNTPIFFNSSVIVETRNSGAGGLSGLNIKGGIG